MKILKVGRPNTYTIYGELKELAYAGLWPLAVLVFMASIAIPMFKLLALGYMLVQTQRHSDNRLLDRSRLYRVLDFIGRWSMVDIFVVSILAGVVRFGWLTQISADTGAVYFTGVVVFTLLAVKSFDPRLMWGPAKKAPGFHATLPSGNPHDRCDAVT